MPDIPPLDDQLPVGCGSRHGPKDVLGRPGHGHQVVPPWSHQGGDLWRRDGCIGELGERAREIHVPIAADEEGIEASTAEEDRKWRGDRRGGVVAQVEIGARDGPIVEGHRRHAVARHDRLHRHQVAAREREGVGSRGRGRPLARIDAIAGRLIGTEAVVDQRYDLPAGIDRDRDGSIRVGAIDVEDPKVDRCPD